MFLRRMIFQIILYVQSVGRAGKIKKRIRYELWFDRLLLLHRKLKEVSAFFVSMNFNGSVLEKNKLEKEVYMLFQMGAFERVNSYNKAMA